jgi:hypothetical protein
MAFNLKEMLGKIAPLAGGMIGGPWGALAGKAIGQVFGHEGDKPLTEIEMEDYVSNATPEQLIALKGIDANLKVSMRELGIKEDELVFDDKKDARATHKDSQMPAILAFILTLGFFGLLIALLVIDKIPTANMTIINIMIGSLGTCWLAAMQYFFGTTKSSGDKTKIMSLK